MKIPFRIITALSLLLPLFAYATDQTDVAVSVDVSQAPQAQKFANVAVPLFQQWYPQINTILYDAEHPLPYPALQLVFEPALAYQGAVAYAAGDTVHVSSTIIAHMQDSYQAMLIHELTHVVQHYPAYGADASWVVEGIADYIRHKYFEKDIQPFLQMNADGRLCGYAKTEPYYYGLQRAGVRLNQAGYRQSYTVASAFLYWLELNKDKNIVRTLNQALSEDKYSEQIFMDQTKLSLDSLWLEFLTISKRSNCITAFGTHN
jgi:hypothetical protein